jgi:TonB family protein
VSPQGAVTDVKLLEASALPAFDTAVLRDARAWRFTAMPGPASVQTCERATLRYLVPR